MLKHKIMTTYTQRPLEGKLRDMLSDAGLKSIDFQMNNSGVRIISFFSTSIAQAEQEMLKRVVEEIPNLLQEYGKWLLENPNAEPLERKAKKESIALSLLSVDKEVPEMFEGTKEALDKLTINPKEK